MLERESAVPIGLAWWQTPYQDKDLRTHMMAPFDAGLRPSQNAQRLPPLDVRLRTGSTPPRKGYPHYALLTLHRAKPARVVEHPQRIESHAARRY